MKKKELIESIVTSANLFVLQIKSQSALDLHDLSIYAEQASIPILDIVFDLKLKSAGEIKRNHPAIDLIDSEKGIAFQLTSTATSTKVVETLQIFVDNKLYEKYPTLYIYILTEKKSDYKTSKIKNIVNGKFDFDVNTHILDYRDILRRINLIRSIKTLKTIAEIYEDLSSLSNFQITKFIENQQTGSTPKIRKQASFIENIREELKGIIGEDNIDKLTELKTSLDNISILEKSLAAKAKEIEECKKALDIYPEQGAIYEALRRTLTYSKEEYDKLKYIIDQQKHIINLLSQNIKRQKEFLNRMDLQKASGRMKEVKILFEAGEFSMVNTLLNYEGRQEYINKKLREKINQSEELESLANEEFFLALSMLQKPDWVENIQLIKNHFEQSIELGGFSLNCYQYSFFLEETGDNDRAIYILRKTIDLLPEDDAENKATLLSRLGKLLIAPDAAAALNIFQEAVDIYGNLFDENNNKYEYPLVKTMHECGMLCMSTSMEQARIYFEQILLLTSNRNHPADKPTQTLTYLTLLALGSLHGQLGDNEQMTSYQQLALQLGANISLDNPKDDLFYLQEAVRRMRFLLNEDKNGPRSNIIYKYALKNFLIVWDWNLQEDVYNIAKALSTLGLHLLVDQETVGAGICFCGALKIFKILNKKGYSCLPDIANNLRDTGFIQMTQNNAEVNKKLLSEALIIRKQLAKDNPVENFKEAASLLDTLYYNSFIGVDPSEFHKAIPFFDEALAIHKDLYKIYNQPDLRQWLQLLHHKSIFISRELDKTDVIIWYQELIGFKNHIPPSDYNFYELDIQMAIHESGQLLIENVEVDNELFLTVAGDVVDARKNLFEKDPETYTDFLLWTFLKVGEKFMEGRQWEHARIYLKNAIELISMLQKKDPEQYDKQFVMPTYNLAFVCYQAVDYNSAAKHYLDLCKYFEARLQEYPDYHTVFISFMIKLIEVYLLDNQLDDALFYITKVMKFLPAINNSSEEDEKMMSLKNLIAAYLPGFSLSKNLSGRWTLTVAKNKNNSKQWWKFW
ncbi:SMEK domain-containing protein [Chitinophaga oryziterrae]|uniref:SMEK domain-containing protein n=1 Tax=Chitinophaga oryziterrae TaxID=1031224 RepID=A0A6N8JDS6_9BACT|nr:SMEK domain-containing protein [Chitinophaga oryziterrae]MVT43475.1 SMEK domain-containing protein [Chitinophaga oryziterrae]